MQSKLSHLLRGWLVYAFLAPVSVMVQIIAKRHLDTFDIAYSVGGTVTVLALAMLRPECAPGGWKSQCRSAAFSCRKIGDPQKKYHSLFRCSFP